MSVTERTRDEARELRRVEAEARLDALLSQDGWGLWLRLRRTLHSYSWGNQVLIAVQAHERGFTPTLVKAGWKWKRDGFHPAKGSKALYVWAFMRRRDKAGVWSCCGQRLQVSKCPSCAKPDHYFALKPVFDACQVVSFETGLPPDLALPQGAPVTGDDPGRRLVPVLCRWAADELDVTVELNVPQTGEERGWWRAKDRTIGLCMARGENDLLRVLIHELAHASGISSRNEELGLTYAEAEVVVECVSFVVAGAVGLDTSSEAIPYMAGWGGEEARGKVRALAQLIDSTAKRIEAVALAALEPTED